MILLLKYYPYHFVRTILSVPFCPIPFCPYTILSVPFCPLPFCPRTPPLVAEQSTRHAATSEERPQNKDGAQQRTQQSRYRQPMQQITHVSKQRRNLGYYYYCYYRLLLVSVQQTNS